jgi:hypothetical protein
MSSGVLFDTADAATKVDAEVKWNAEWVALL